MLALLLFQEGASCIGWHPSVNYAFEGGPQCICTLILLVHVLSQGSVLCFYRNRNQDHSSLMCQGKTKAKCPSTQVAKLDKGQRKTSRNLRYSGKATRKGEGQRAKQVGNSKRGDLGVEGNSSQPVSVALPTHDEVSSGQMPHLPRLVVTARNLHKPHSL